jgi:hypothetical protein
MSTGIRIHRYLGEARKVELIVNDRILATKCAADGKITTGCNGACQGTISYCCHIVVEGISLPEPVAKAIFGALDNNLNITG